MAVPIIPTRGPRRQRAGIYARFSTKYQHSTEDQVRKCREWAERNGLTVRPEHVFVDEAVTGRSSRRSGLAALRQALQDNQIDVVICLATNRLFRKAYKAAQFVEEEIVDRGKRAVFIDTNIDTADEGRWRQYFQIHSMLDEFTATSTVGHIRASQEGLFLQGRVFGSLTFGYCGQEVPGLTTRKGGPARRIVIDPVAAEWVQKAFHWFLQERLSILQIAQRLNAEGAPPPPHVTDGRHDGPDVRAAPRLRLAKRHPCR
jgi:DNA invertase Pin-like site-specific DNA recombinase